MEKFVFTSLVGNQIFGVLNAIMCAVSKANKLYPVSRIILYPTADLQEANGKIRRGTAVESQNIKQFCEEHNYPPVEIYEFDSRNNIFEDFIKEHLQNDEGVLFNMEGGMNYAVSQYVSALVKQKRRAGLLITDGQYCQTSLLDRDFLLENSTWDQSIKIPSLDTEEILRIQRTQYTTDRTPTVLSSYISYWLEDSMLPKDVMTNVTIGAVKADLLWNCGGNHLAMLISPGSSSKDISRAPTEVLARIRNISQWAASKPDKKKFYDANCYVLCEKDVHIESLQRESRGKAIPLKSTWGFVSNTELHTYPMVKDKRQNKIEKIEKIETTIPLKLKKELQSILRKKEAREHVDDKRRTQVTVESDTLIMALGTDVATNLIAATSHMAEQHFKTIILLHCESLEVKALKVKERIAALPDHPKIRRIIIDTKGRYIPFRLRLAKDAKNVEINITPGTKGQTSYLTYFAQINHLKIWSIDRSDIALIEPVELKTRFPITTVNPLDMLKIDDKAVDCRKSEINVSLMCQLLDEFKKEDTTPENLKKLLSDHQYDLIKLNDNDEFKVVNFKRKDEKRLGIWFEEFTYVALKAIRNCKCYQGVELKHSQVAGGHITEYDCLCGYEHMVLAISCKAFLNCTREKLLLKIKDPLSEVVSFAASVERFGLPVLCVLDKFNLPTILTESKTKAKVAIIDIKDLAEPEKLVTIFKELDEEYKVSAEGSTEQDQPL